ncbi:MAG: RidA family protein [Bacteroidota bacterium]
MKEFRNPLDVHPPLAGYTHQVEITGPERLLIISGQVGRTVEGQVPADPVQQLEIACANLIRNLRAAQMDAPDIVKINLYLVGRMDAEKRRQVLVSWLGGHKPCMTLVYVAGLAAPQYKVELEAWAAKPEQLQEPPV